MPFFFFLNLAKLHVTTTYFFFKVKAQNIPMNSKNLSGNTDVPMFWGSGEKEIDSEGKA